MGGSNQGMHCFSSVIMTRLVVLMMDVQQYLTFLSDVWTKTEEFNISSNKVFKLTTIPEFQIKTHFNIQNQIQWQVK